MKNFLTHLVLFVFLFCAGDCVKCFKCTSGADASGNCFTGICDDGTVCFKRETVSNGRAQVEKGCEPTGIAACLPITVPGGFGATACQCTTDWCNAAYATTPATLFILGCSIALMLLVKSL